MTTETKTYDKRDRAIKAAVAAIGAKAVLGLDYEVSKTESKPVRYTWAKLDQSAAAYQPKVKDRVHNTQATVDGMLRPDIHGTVMVVGPTVSEVKWDNPAPWGQIVNCLNKHLALVEKGLDAAIEKAVVKGLDPKKAVKVSDPTLSLGMLGPLPGGDEDVPGFLKVENRKPLSPEKKAALDKRMEEAKVIKPAAEAKRDLTLPKNIEPAGLEILAASGLGRKKAVTQINGEAPPPSSRGRRKGNEGKWTLRTTYDLFNSLAPQAKLEQRKGKTGFLDRKTAHKVLSLLQGELTKAKVNLPADLKEALQAMQP